MEIKNGTNIINDRIDIDLEVVKDRLGELAMTIIVKDSIISNKEKEILKLQEEIKKLQSALAPRSVPTLSPSDKKE